MSRITGHETIATHLIEVTVKVLKANIEQISKNGKLEIYLKKIKQFNILRKLVFLAEKENAGFKFFTNLL